MCAYLRSSCKEILLVRVYQRCGTCLATWSHWYDWTAADVGCGPWVVNHNFTCMQGICKLSFRNFICVPICKVLVMKYYWLESINAVLRVLQLPWYDWTAAVVGCGLWVVNYDFTCMQEICKLSFRNFMHVAAHIYNFCVPIFVCCSPHVWYTNSDTMRVNWIGDWIVKQIFNSLVFQRDYLSHASTYF